MALNLNDDGSSSLIDLSYKFLLGGLDDLLANIIDVCHAQDVPVIFSLNRQVLGKVLLKKVPVSIVGIFYYDGAQVKIRVSHFNTTITIDSSLITTNTIIISDIIVIITINALPK